MVLCIALCLYLLILKKAPQWGSCQNKVILCRWTTFTYFFFMKTYIILYTLPQFHIGNSRAALPCLPSLCFAISLLHTPSISNLAAIVGKAASFLFSSVVLMTPLLRHPLRYYLLLCPFFCICTIFAGSFPSAFMYKQNDKSLSMLGEKETSLICFSSGVWPLQLFSPLTSSKCSQPPLRQLLNTSTPSPSLQLSP